MPSILRTPKVQLIIALLLISLSAFFYFPDISNLYLIIIAILANSFFDLTFTYLKRKTFFVPYAAIVTGLIMGLIINQSSGFFQILIAAFFAMMLKNFLRIQGRHIFNPAASGLFISSILFNEYIGWWGVSFQRIDGSDFKNIFFFLILISPFLISAIRFKKYYMILTYLAINIIISLLFFPVFDNFFTNLIANLLNPSTLFFALVMLPEPMTSPINYKRQIMYGALIVIIPTFFSFPFISQISQIVSFDPLLFSLLLGNLVFFKNR